jgi:hypothetical protein
VDSPVVLLLQDWSSDETLSKDFNDDVARRGLTLDSGTNTRLEELLREVFGRDLTEVYGTNLFPFVKPGSISSPIPFAHLVRAAKEFAVPQIEIVSRSSSSASASGPTGRSPSHEDTRAARISTARSTRRRFTLRKRRSGAKRARRRGD